MTAPITPSPGDLPPDAPATIEDVRASRRWTFVALAWAVAASIIAVLALMSADDEPAPAPQQTSEVSAAQFQKLQKDTSDRLDAFERRITQRASQDDVQKLEKRLGTAEDDASEAKEAAGKSASSEDLEALQTKADDLEQRIEELEQNQDSGATP